jgi:hypothetical protein
VKFQTQKKYKNISDQLRTKGFKKKLKDRKVPKIMNLNKIIFSGIGVSLLLGIDGIFLIR